MFFSCLLGPWIQPVARTSSLQHGSHGFGTISAYANAYVEATRIPVQNLCESDLDVLCEVSIRKGSQVGAVSKANKSQHQHTIMLPQNPYATWPTQHAHVSRAISTNDNCLRCQKISSLLCRFHMISPWQKQPQRTCQLASPAAEWL